jgi:hypothetical protein
MDDWHFEAFLLAHHELRRVGQAVIDGVTVSTVHLGVPHGLHGQEHYETMVFGGPLDEHQWRYETYEQAVAGHEQVCALVREHARSSS